MQQKMLFLFGEFDNQLRKQKCMAGIKEMLLRGDWPTQPPLGFDIVRINGKRNIVVNQKGKLIGQAFLWKAEQSLSNQDIKARLAQKGLKLNHQRISEIFRNPFYCGLMCHNMLEGKVIKGNHEQLIAQDLFLKVNGLLDKNTHGYTINEENEAIALKRFLLCGCCNKPLRGYVVKKKNLYYYKCSTIGCNNNKSASALNQTFGQILEYFKIDAAFEVIDLIKKEMLAIFNQLTKGHQDECEGLQKHYADLKKKIERLEERFIEEEINAELYNKFAEKYKAEKAEIEDKVLQSSRGVSNLDKCVNFAVEYASKIASRWHSSSYSVKQQLQFLLFPEGIAYDRKIDGCRTSRINSVFLYLAYLQQIMTNKKRGIPELGLDYASFADLVAGAGLEPMSADWRI
jgi:hypothetical protein